MEGSIPQTEFVLYFLIGRLEMNVTDQLQIHADDVNLVGKNINVIKKHKALLGASKKSRYKVTQVYLHVSSPYYRTKSLFKKS
jgi:hypothetical protein